MRKTLLGQVFPTYFATVVACLLALAAVTTALTRSFAYDLAHDELSDMLSMVEKRFFAGPTIPADAAEAELANLFSGLAVRMTVIAPDGKVLADSQADAATLESHWSRPEFVQALKDGEGSSVRFSDSVKGDLIYLAKAVRRGGATVAVLRASKPLPLLQERLFAYYWHLAIAGALVLAASAALAFASVRRINRPLMEMSETARSFGGGDFSKRSRVSEPEELKLLSDTLNAMAGQLAVHIADIERRRGEAEAILGGMAEGVVVLDREMRVVKTNGAALSLLGKAAQGVPDAPGAAGGPIEGSPFLEAFRSTELQGYARKALDGGESVEGTVSIYSSTGIGPSARTLQVYAATIGGRDGAGCLLVLHDITRLVRLEQVRKDFVANVSHELRTPITSIKGFVETLSDGALDDPEQARRFLDIISRHVGRLEDIIDDLTALARLEQQERQPLETESLPLEVLLENARLVCASKAAAKGMTLSIACPADLEAVVSPTLMEQAVVNLLDNAVKYSPEGSAVRVEALKDGDDALVRVADSGRGIPAKDLSRIFERFYRVEKGRGRDKDAGGTGLGLAIVKHVMAAHGGSVSVESWEGSGSVFTLRFPLSPPSVNGRG